jgi:hypothetical protein
LCFLCKFFNLRGLIFPYYSLVGITFWPTCACTIPTVKTASKGAIDQLGHSLTHIIHAFVETEEDARIFMAKWDIKDGFWRMDAEDGAKWNFACVLPQCPGQPIYLVVPTSLQMGWLESTPFFCAASEMA